MGFLLPDEETHRRLEICRACDRFLAMAQLCKECLCFMPAKARLSHAECPIGKWGPVKETDHVC